jgi:NAD(P)-dependent dehydrogenase (short-subunit alcohol dehydrogenase family)
MGRDLARLLTEQGCDVAICDVSDDNMQQTKQICEKIAPQGVVISTHVCDVAEPEAVNRFKDEVAATHQRGYINLLFNNAGVGGGGGFVNGDEQEWDRTFSICWGGVLNCSRAFMPLLVASSEGHLINTSSVNGFWASLGPHSSHTAYASAKFAVKGFSEALVNDLRINAPHVLVSVVMPGHIGTPLVTNSNQILGNSDPDNMSPEDIEKTRNLLLGTGAPVENATTEEIVEALRAFGDMFNELALTTSEDAAKTILAGVLEEKWRILVGEDAFVLDRLVRSNPEGAYDQEFFDTLTSETQWLLGS